MIFTCRICNVEFTRYKSAIEKAKARNSTIQYCSMSCRNEGYKGKGNPKWRGGRTVIFQGYVLIYKPKHPFKDKDGYVREHRLVMEKKLGRYLKQEEVVHHINEIKDDNRIKNLQLLKNGAQHRIEHAHYKTRKCSECGKKILRSISERRKWKVSCCSRRCAAARGSAANKLQSLVR